ncbi:unnamed protein product [Parnassius apollo]|uniref:(apollo) hypothetical protein n=1 Tax=Parnassius apollo TaxID=110799 RepID=A0A8S3XV39_PARAO|nr:unnamed protein product [Parnassius apollo]
MRCCSSGLSNACGVLHQRRVPIAGPAKIPADTKPAGGDDGCEGLLGGRAAPRARLAVRMLPRPAPAPDAPWRPPGSGPLRVLPYSIIHSGGRHLSGRRPDPAPFHGEAMCTSGPLHLQFLPRHGTNTSWQGAD